MNNLRGPVTNALNSLSSVFAIIIGFDVFMVVVLGTMEAIIERITGDSATFENGKMITLRRSELHARRQQALAVKPQQKAQRVAAAPSGPPSVYKLAFPIPGAPGKEAVTPSPQIVISHETKSAIPPQHDSRSGPAVIFGAVTEKLPAPSASPVPSNPAAPLTKPAGLTSGSQSSPFKPATPGSLLSPTPPSSDKPATPVDITPSTSASPFASPVRPVPKPVNTFTSIDEDEDVENEDIEDSDEEELGPKTTEQRNYPLASKSREEDNEDEVSYEDFEDPA
jgi:hypothetical protein